MGEDDKLSIEQLLLLENLTYLVDGEGSRTLVTINSTAGESNILTVEQAIDKIDIMVRKLSGKTCRIFRKGRRTFVRKDWGWVYQRKQ